MMSVTAALVKELREKSGAGMMDCKKALNETNGDMDAAIDWLRTKGLAAAAKKSGRVASEGLVAISVSGTLGALVELNSETDFVSRNDDFQTFAKTLSSLALTASDIEALKAMDYPNTGRTVAEELTHKIATIGENMSLRRMEKVSVESGAIVPYIHNATADGLGRIGVLLAFHLLPIAQCCLVWASRLRCILLRQHLRVSQLTILTLKWLPVSVMC